MYSTAHPAYIVQFHHLSYLNYASLPLPLPGVIIFYMSTLFPDTHPEAEAVLIRLLQQAPPWRKLEMVGQMNAAVQRMMFSGLRTRYPKDSPERLRRRMADLLLGPALAMKVYGSLPEESHGN